MQENDIRDFLIGYGVNQHAKGFNYAIELIKLKLEKRI